MSDKTTWSAKVVDNLFGDDAGFLSWLGIDAPADSTNEKEIVVVKKKEKNNDDVPSEKKEEKKHPVYAKDDIIPSMKEAKVIRSARDEKKDTSRKDVDDLIKRKTQTDKSAYSDIMSWKRSGGARTNTGSRTWAGWRRWSSRWNRWRWTQWSSRSGGISSSIRIWATKHRTSNKKAQQAQAAEKQKKTYKVSDSLKKKSIVQIWDSITVKEFSEKMWVPFPEVMKVLLSNKIITAAHAHIDFDTATLVATEFDVTIEKERVDMSVEDVFDVNLQAILDQDKTSDALLSRPPVVTIMGHVDHGKTKLLDYLRQTDVVWWEAWGITQSIWASQITHNDQKITFIDTPWHELFTAIRARGSKITNIVIVVVAANEWLKPQTIEAINHAKDAEVPIIVAVTKIDLWWQKIEEIKWALAQHGLQPEDRWGDTMIVPCSAMTWQGIDDLLDSVLLQYEMLELQYDPARPAVWVVVESHKDAKQGVTTTMLLMTWTLRVWDIVAVHNTYGRVRRMTDRTWKKIKQAVWWDPVMILGIQDLPEPGRIAEVVSSDKEASKKIEAIRSHEQSISKESLLFDMMDKIGKGDKVQLKLIIKADSFGGLEAVKHAAQQVPLPENVVLKIVHDDVGDITTSDLTFAQAAKAIVIGYNVSISASLKKKADQMQVVVKNYTIVYEFLDYLEKLGEGMIEKELVEVITWKLEVLGVFFRRGKEMIFGGKVTEGKFVNKWQIRVYREGEWEVDEEGNQEPFATWFITSLQREQDSVREVKEGYECGMKVKVNKKVEIGDIIECFVME